MFLLAFYSLENNKRKAIATSQQLISHFPMHHVTVFSVSLSQQLPWLLEITVFSAVFGRTRGKHPIKKTKRVERKSTQDLCNRARLFLLISSSGEVENYGHSIINRMPTSWVVRTSCFDSLQMSEKHLSFLLSKKSLW